MLRRAIFWAFSGQIATFVVSFAGSVVIARLLSPHELGVYAVATAVLALLQIATSFGTAAFVVKQPELDERLLDTAFTINAALSLALAVAVVIGSYPAARFLNEASVVPVLQLLALTPLLGIPEFRPAAMLQREMQFKAISLIGTARVAGATIATVAAAYAGASSLSPAWGALAGSAIGLVGFLIFGRQYISMRMSLHGWRAMTIFGMQMMSVSGVSAASGRLSDIVMGRLLGLDALGLYSRANNLSNLLVSNIYGTATRIVFVKLSKDFRERGVVRDTFLPSLRMVSAVMGPITIGAAILSRPLINLLYGAKWLSAAPVLSIIMVAQFVALSFAMTWELYVVRNELGTQTKFEIARSICSLLSQGIGCLFSIIGAAFGYLFGAFFSFWVYAPHMRRIADARPGELGRIYAETTALTCITVAPSLVLMTAYGWSADTPILAIVGAVLLGGLLWLVSLMKIDHPLGAEIALLARKGAGRFRSFSR